VRWLNGVGYVGEEGKQGWEKVTYVRRLNRVGSRLWRWEVKRSGSRLRR
jgi:hypothetical protein